jgi:hypothetical protein
MKPVRQSVFLLLGISTSLFAQSTSSWQRIGNTTGTDSTPSLGASYVTVVFRQASVYQNANWWTQLQERNRKATLDVGVLANFGNLRLSDAKMSHPITIKKDGSDVSFGYTGVVVGKLPTTYSNLKISVGVSKEAQDGVEQMLSTVAALSAANPAIGVSQAAMGIVTASKQIIDVLFNKQLVERKLGSELDMTPGNAVLPPGVYVALAGDRNSDWQGYFTTPSGGKGLTWENGVLTFNSKPVQKVSYFVIELSYDKRVFKSPTDALSLNPAAKPWVGLYSVARQKIGSIIDKNTAKQVVSEVRSALSDARALLETDLDYVSAERDAIHNAIFAQVDTLLKVRQRLVAAATGDSILLVLDNVVDPKLNAALAAELQATLKVMRPVCCSK